MKGGSENEEFGEETRERGDTGKREEGEREREGIERMMGEKGGKLIDRVDGRKM